MTPADRFHYVIQVAGVRDAAEAVLLRDVGVDLIGFPLRLPVHAEDLSEAEAARVIRQADIADRAVCITYETDPAELLALCVSLDVRVLQLHGEAGPEVLAALKAADPDLALIKSLVVGRGPAAELFALRDACAQWADAFITDSFDPTSGACGATGLVHDWAVSRELAVGSPKPLILAGGLNPDNVAAAIAAVRPAGVDAHTGLEDASGAKDSEKVQRFVSQARIAWGL